MPSKGGGKNQALLADPDVKRWYDNVARGSRATADNYLRVLGRFLLANSLTPKSLVQLGDKERDDLISDQVTSMLDAGKAGSYVEVTKRAVASWLDWNGKRITRRIKVPGASHRPSLRDAHIPTQDELRRVLNVADARARTAIALMAFSGVRPEVLGNYLGSDGLRLKDFPEARVHGTEVQFEEVPARLVVPKHMSKTGRAYFTFLGAEGCEYVAAYLGERRANGEEISKDSPIITPKNVDKAFMRTLNVSDLIRKPMRAAGLKEPPYMWRSYFASRSMLAEGKGFTRDFRQFCMGHVGDIEHVYALHKELPPDTIETMRKGYEAALEFLETGTRVRGEDPTVKMLSVLLQAAGFTDKELNAMNLAAKSEEELVELLKNGPVRSGHAAPPNAKPMQRIIALTHLDAALADGWLYKTTLPDGRAIVETGTRGFS